MLVSHRNSPPGRPGGLFSSRASLTIPGRDEAPGLVRGPHLVVAKELGSNLAYMCDRHHREVVEVLRICEAPGALDPGASREHMADTRHMFLGRHDGDLRRTEQPNVTTVTDAKPPALSQPKRR
jgi:hypothetical protein